MPKDRVTSVGRRRGHRAPFRKSVGLPIYVAGALLVLALLTLPARGAQATVSIRPPQPSLMKLDHPWPLVGRFACSAKNQAFLGISSTESKDTVITWDDGRVFAWEPDGSMRWSQVIRPAGAGGGPGPRLGADAFSLALAHQGELILMEAASGRVVWKVGVQCDWGPVVVGSYVLTGSRDALQAYTVLSGSLAWERRLPLPQEDLTKGIQLMPVQAGGNISSKLVVAVTEAVFLGIDPENGKILWQLKRPAPGVPLVLDRTGAMWCEGVTVSCLAWNLNPKLIQWKVRTVPGESLTQAPAGMGNGWAWLVQRRQGRDYLAAYRIPTRGDGGAAQWTYYLGSAGGVDLGLGGNVSFPEPREPPRLAERVATCGFYQGRLMVLRRIHETFPGASYGLFSVMDPASGKVEDLYKLGPLTKARFMVGSRGVYLELTSPAPRRIIYDDPLAPEIAMSNQLPPLQVLRFAQGTAEQPLVPPASPAAMLAGSLALREQALTLVPGALKVINGYWSGRLAQPDKALLEYNPAFRLAVAQDPTNPYLWVLLALSANSESLGTREANLLLSLSRGMQDQFDAYGALNLVLACGRRDQAELALKVIQAYAIKENQNPALVFRHPLFSPVVMAYPYAGAKGTTPRSIFVPPPAARGSLGGGEAPPARASSEQAGKPAPGKYIEQPALRPGTPALLDRVLMRGRATFPLLSDAVAGDEETWQQTVWLANRACELSPHYACNYFLWATIYEFELARGRFYTAESTKDTCKRYYRQKDLSLLSPRMILWMDLLPYLIVAMGMTLILISFLAARRFRDLRHHHMQEDGLDPAPLSLQQWLAAFTPGERVVLPLLGLYSLFTILVYASARLDLFGLPFRWVDDLGHNLVLALGVAALTGLVCYLPFLSFQVRLRRSLGRVPGVAEGWKYYWRYQPAFYLNTRERTFIILLFLLCGILVAYLDYRVEYVRDLNSLQQVAFQGGLPAHMGWSLSDPAGKSAPVSAQGSGYLVAPRAFISAGSNNFNRQYLEGFAAMWCGTPQAAARYFSQAARSQRHDLEAVGNLGCVLLPTSTEKSLEILQSVRLEHWQDTRLLFDLGLLKSVTGDADGGKNLLELARGKSPSELTVYMYLHPLDYLSFGVSDQRLKMACVNWDWRYRWLLGLTSFWGVPSALDLLPTPDLADPAQVLSRLVRSWPPLVGCLLLWIWLAAVIVGGLARPRGAWPFPCDRCGRPTCDHCVLVDKKKLLCRQCQVEDLPLPKPSALASALGTLGLILTPGFWQLRQGKTMRGTIFLMIFLCFGLMLFYVHANGGVLLHWMLGEMSTLVSGAYLVAGDPNLSPFFSGLRSLFGLVLLANLCEVLFLRGKRETKE